jgi:hypothetical protein
MVRPLGRGGDEGRSDKCPDLFGRGAGQTSWEGWGLGVDADRGVVVGGGRSNKCPDLFGRGGWWMRMEEWWREGVWCGRVGDGKEEQG